MLASNDIGEFLIAPLLEKRLVIFDLVVSAAEFQKPA